MPRINRSAKPGQFHHCGSRAVGQRPLFESQSDYRFMEYLLEKKFMHKECRARLHTYCLMPNHTHFFVGPKVEAVSAAMGPVLQQYSRWFNQRRGREGPLYASRFFNSVPSFGAAFIKVANYIDQNPVQAHLAETAAAHPWGSARAYLNGNLPPWIDSSMVEAHLQRELA